MQKAHTALSLLCLILAYFHQVECWGDLDDHPKAREVQATCQKEAPVPADIYARAQKADFQKDNVDLQKYQYCVFRKAGAMDENGKVDMSAFTVGMKPEAAAFYGPNFLLCEKEVTDTDKYLKSMNLYQCFKEKHGDKYYFV